MGWVGSKDHLLRRARTQDPGHGRGLETLEQRLLFATFYVDAGQLALAPDGRCWQTAYPDLQAALATAQSGDRILVAGGEYRPTSGSDRTASFALPTGVTMAGGYAGSARPGSPGTLDRLNYPSILSGDIGTHGSSIDNSNHVVIGSGAAASSILDGFTIENGRGDTGAGMYTQDGSPTLRNCIFRMNVASTGGAMYNRNASPRLINCSFVGNSASGSDGGAIYNLQSSPSLVSCYFGDNIAGSGGALYNISSQVSVSNCRFRNNLAFYTSSGTIVTISGGAGGAVFSSVSTLSLSGCTFEGNRAPTNDGSHISHGGAIFNEYRSPLTAVNCTFADNEAGYGGAVYGDSLRLTHCTFASNAAEWGRSIHTGQASASVKIANSILWGPSAGQIDDGGSPIQVTYSDIRGGYVGAGNIDRSPRFFRDVATGPDGKWGTADDDFGNLHLAAGSPAIDAGNNTATGSLATDLEGKKRKVDVRNAADTGRGPVPIADMGAYEADILPPTGLRLSNVIVPENLPMGTTVGVLSATDPNAGESFRYSLVGATTLDNAKFAIDGASLKTRAAFDFEAKTSYAIRVRVTDISGLSFTGDFAIKIANVNEPPATLSISSRVVPEHQPAGTLVGTLSATDPERSTQFSYSLVDGGGAPLSPDNAAFKLARTSTGTRLLTATRLNYETRRRYNLVIRVRDAGGNYADKPLSISVSNINESPQGISLMPPAVPENSAAGTVVGVLSTVDPDLGNRFTYSLVSGAGSADNAAFSILGNQLRTRRRFNYEARSTYSIRVRAKDQGGLFCDRVIAVGVSDVNEPPAGLVLAPPTVLPGAPASSVVGSLSATDPDAGTILHYLLVSTDAELSAGCDSSKFAISGNQLLVGNEALTGAAGQAYHILVRVSDDAGLYYDKALVVTVASPSFGPA